MKIALGQVTIEITAPLAHLMFSRSPKLWHRTVCRTVTTDIGKDRTPLRTSTKIIQRARTLSRPLLFILWMLTLTSQHQRLLTPSTITILLEQPMGRLPTRRPTPVSHVNPLSIRDFQELVRGVLPLYEQSTDLSCLAHVAEGMFGRKTPRLTKSNTTKLYDNSY
jgi:hypothetical protein